MVWAKPEIYVCRLDPRWLGMNNRPVGLAQLNWSRLNVVVLASSSNVQPSVILTTQIGLLFKNHPANKIGQKFEQTMKSLG